MNARVKARVTTGKRSGVLEQSALLLRSEENVASVGDATGIAWTSVGGDIVFDRNAVDAGHG